MNLLLLFIIVYDLFASPAPAAVADLRVEPVLPVLALVGPVGLQARLSGSLPETLASTRLEQMGQVSLMVK